MIPVTAIAVAAHRGNHNSQAKLAHAEKRQEKHMPLEPIKGSSWFSWFSGASLELLQAVGTEKRQKKHMTLKPIKGSSWFSVKVMVLRMSWFSVSTTRILAGSWHGRNLCIYVRHILADQDSIPHQLARLTSSIPSIHPQTPITPHPISILLRMFSYWPVEQSPDPTGLGTVTENELVQSAAEFTASVQSLSTETSEPDRYEESARRWAHLEPALKRLLQQGRGAPQAVRTAYDSGKTVKIMSAYTILRRCEPHSPQGVIIRQKSAGYEEVTYGDGKPSQLDSEQMDRLKQATSVAGYDELHGEPYRAVHDWILRNQTTTAK